MDTGPLGPCSSFIADHVILSFFAQSLQTIPHFSRGYTRMPTSRANEISDFFSIYYVLFINYFIIYWFCNCNIINYYLFLISTIFNIYYLSTVSILIFYIVILFTILYQYEYFSIIKINIIYLYWFFLFFTALFILQLCLYF